MPTPNRDHRPDTAATTVDIETLLRKLPLGALSLDAQEAVDELFAKADPLTPEQRKRFVKAASRALKVRREILTLATFACNHRPTTHTKWCPICDAEWPCPEVRRTAGPALDALADLS